LVDPKKVELTNYSKLERHFLATLPGEEEAIITDYQKVVYTLRSLTQLMYLRYDLMKKANVRNIKEYNAKFINRQLNPENQHIYMPYIVLVIDEFADLIMTAGREVEEPIARLAQLARAVGIHLIIATQRPSINIITGSIKANIPARIAFKVTSMIDSRTIIDQPGANHLIGRGDMLITEAADLVRIQCAFIDTPEIEKITTFIGAQKGYPTAYLLPEVKNESSGDVKDEDIDINKRDEIFEEAAKLVVEHQQGSTSLIQRKFAIGYNRAGRIIDQLEAAGIVGPFEGSKARRVLFTDLHSLEQYLTTLEKP
jgi:S-DNA-T family DNA segregation ATPase FtsK/SpoIIIE